MMIQPRGVGELDKNEYTSKKRNNHMCNIYDKLENWWSNTSTPFYNIYLGEIDPKFISYLWNRINDLEYNNRCHPNKEQTTFGFLDLETNNYSSIYLSNEYQDLDLLVVSHAERLNIDNILELRSIGISTILIYKRDEVLGIPGIERKNPFKVIYSE